MVSGGGGLTNDPPLRFRILGPLEVDVGAQAADLGGPMQRALLAHLLLRANQLVPADALVDSLWGDEEPETARGVVHTYVSLLRRAIGKERIEGRPPGYVLVVKPDELDASRFDRLLRDAKRTLPADPTHALVTIDDALRLWRGPALADLANQPGIKADAVRLDDLRLDAEEARVLALLSTDQPRLAIAEVERLLIDEPLREGLWGLLMVALYREGRQADALQAYGRARRLLRDEPGVDPSPELERVQQRVLRQDPDLEARGERLRGYQLLEKVRTRPELVVYRARQPRVGRDVAWSGDSRRLATASSDGSIRVWDATKPGVDVPLASLTVNALRPGAMAVAVSTDGRRIFGSGSDGSVAGWDIGPGSSDEVLAVPTIERLGDVAFTPDGQWLVAADETGQLTWRPLHDGGPVRAVGPQVQEHWFELSPDGSSIAIMSEGEPLTVWSTVTDVPIFTSSLFDVEFDWNPDGSQLIAGDMLLDLTGREVGGLRLDGFIAREPRFSADGRLVAVTGNGYSSTDGEEGPPRVVIWDVQAQRSNAVIEAASFDAVFDPKGSRLALDGQGVDEPTVWDVASAKPLFALAGAGTVFDVTFSPNGSIVATAGEDGAVRLFDARNGASIGVLWNGPPSVRTVEFSPDGRMLAAQRPGEVRVWAVDIDLLLDFARARLTRSLTEDECRQFLHLDHCPPPAQ